MIVWLRRGATFLGILAIFAGFAAATILSPLGLALLRDGFGEQDWVSLSGIGQTYGAASAIIAGVALIGVGISLALQAREAKATREQSIRAIHAHLLELSLGDTELVEVWGPFVPGASPTVQRQQLYANLIMSHWQMLFEIGQLTRAALRGELRVFFSGAPGVTFWQNAGGTRRSSSSTHLAKVFHGIVEDQFRKSGASAESASLAPWLSPAIAVNAVNAVNAEQLTTPSGVDQLPVVSEGNLEVVESAGLHAEPDWLSVRDELAGWRVRDLGPGSKISATSLVVNEVLPLPGVERAWEKKGALLVLVSEEDSSRAYRVPVFLRSDSDRDRWKTLGEILDVVVGEMSIAHFPRGADASISTGFADAVSAALGAGYTVQIEEAFEPTTPLAGRFTLSVSAPNEPLGMACLVEEAGGEWKRAAPRFPLFVAE